MVKAVGVSNYSAAETRSLSQQLDKRGMKLATNQIEFSLLRRSPETGGLLGACQELGVLPLAYSPIGQGRLTGKYSAAHPPPGKRTFSNHPMESVDVGGGRAPTYRGEERGPDPSQVALNWVMSKGVVPIPGAKNRHQAEENAGALGWSIDEDDLAQLDGAALAGIRSLEEPVLPARMTDDRGASAALGPVGRDRGGHGRSDGGSGGRSSPLTAATPCTLVFRACRPSPEPAVRP